MFLFRLVLTRWGPRRNGWCIAEAIPLNSTVLGNQFLLGFWLWWQQSMGFDVPANTSDLSKRLLFMFHVVEAVVKLSNFILRNGTQKLMIDADVKRSILSWMAMWGKNVQSCKLNATHFKFVRGIECYVD